MNLAQEEKDVVEFAELIGTVLSIVFWSVVGYLVLWYVPLEIIGEVCIAFFIGWVMLDLAGGLGSLLAGLLMNPFRPICAMMAGNDFIKQKRVAEQERKVARDKKMQFDRDMRVITKMNHHEIIEFAEDKGIDTSGTIDDIRFRLEPSFFKDPVIIQKRRMEDKLEGERIRALEEEEQRIKQMVFAAPRPQVREKNISIQRKEKCWNEQYGLCRECRNKKDDMQFYWIIYPKLVIQMLCKSCASEKNLLVEEEEVRRRSRSISRDVQNRVWNRDNGECVECASKENLEFDHIIPHSKGGSNSYRNIQLLCQDCNRKKSDSIG